MEEILMNVYDGNTFVGTYDIDSFLKRKFGEGSTLFNTAQACAPIFRLEGMTDELMDEVNGLFDAKGHAAVRDRCALILQHCKVSFVGYPVAKRQSVKHLPKILNCLIAI